MSKYQEFMGIKFREEWPGGYYIHNFTGYNIRMHRFVWEYYNGSIPEGYDVHHIDGNRANNDITNLQLLKSYAHKKLHGEMLSDAEREWRRQNLNNNARPKAVDWHKSEEGSEWHKEHIRQQHRDGVFKKKLICTQCGKEYIGEQHKKGGNTFCSNACKAKYRRKLGIDNIECECVICGKKFMSNKIRPAKCCSQSCGSVLAYKSRHK